MAAVDLVIVAVIFCAGTWIGTRAVQSFRSAGGAQYFYQREFGPAAMFACGRGFENPDTRNAPVLEAFLFERSDTVDCAAVAATIPVMDLTPFQRASRYLELAVALTWKMTGVSWSRLAILPGVFFGAVAAITYCVFRLGLSRMFALLAMVPVVTSTPNLMLVPQLRDYAKGPFLLAVILIMGILVLGPAGRRRTIGLSALGGAVVGIGLGFRSDLVIAVFPFLLAIALLAPAGVSVRTRIVAIAVFLTSFVVTAFPILKGYSQGGNTGHVVLLGLAPDFDGPLRIQPSEYEFLGQYNDTFAFSTINSYVVRVENRPDGVDLASAEYDRAARRYLEQIAAVFPADVIIRVVAAIRAIPKYFLDSSLYPPVQVQSEAGRAVYSLRARILWRLAPLGFLAVAVATLLVSAAHPRAACLIVLVMIGFAGASAIQFHERHFYYLQLIPWLAFAFLAETAFGWRRLFSTVTRRDVQRAMVFGAVVVGLAASAIVLSRAYQQQTAERLFERYLRAPRAALAAVQKQTGTGRTLIATPEWLGPIPDGVPWIATRFLAVQFRDDLCGAIDLPVTIRYSGAVPDADLSYRKTVRLQRNPVDPTTLFVAAYDRADETVRFRGIEVAADQVRCVGGLSRVVGIDQEPLLLTIPLAAGWRQQRLYQRLR